MNAAFQMMKNMHKNLPWRNTFASASNMNKELPTPLRHWITGGRRDYASMPAILKMEDGTPVTTPEQWPARRAEILALFEEHVYGTLPKTGFTTSFEVLADAPALDGAAILRQIKITVTTDKGSSDALMALYLPASAADTPAPVVLGLNFGGNHTILDDPALLESCAYVKQGAGAGMPEGLKISEEMLARLAQMRAPGGAAENWSVEYALSRGFGIASIYANDFAPDNAAAWNTRVLSLFEDDNLSTVGAWAFGLMRGIDYLVQDPQVDADKLAVTGHSRLGKAACWAAANDERVAILLSNDAGCTGSSLSRGNRGETVKSITASFPHWFSPNYATYGDNLDDLPVDQHQLLACMAPRRVYVGMAAGDLWADPQGSWNALMMSRKAFKLHGLGILKQGVKDSSVMKMPAADGQAYFAESMGFHVRQGWHDVKKEDWEHYLDFMEECWK